MLSYSSNLETVNLPLILVYVRSTHFDSPANYSPNNIGLTIERRVDNSQPIPIQPLFRQSRVLGLVWSSWHGGLVRLGVTT